MAQADLQGSDGHGVSRLPQYARRIRAGGFNTKPNIRVVREQASTALVNGDNGMGHLVMSCAAEVAIAIRGSARMPGVERIAIPGERSEATRMQRGRDGIPIAPALKRGLDQLADELGIATLGW
jgi:LDH2 family malate/lactate/ureidoglycolate dehydrogenase